MAKIKEIDPNCDEPFRDHFSIRFENVCYYLIYLALLRSHEAKTFYRAVDIADALGLNINNIRVTFTALSATGIIQTRKAQDGGIRLLRAPNRIRLGTILRALQPLSLDVPQIPHKLSFKEAIDVNRRRASLEAILAMYAVFDAWTLQDLMTNIPRNSAQLLKLPATDIRRGSYDDSESSDDEVSPIEIDPEDLSAFGDQDTAAPPSAEHPAIVRSSPVRRLSRRKVPAEIDPPSVDPAPVIDRLSSVTARKTPRKGS